MDSIGDIHITKTPVVIKNFYGIGLFEATEIFNCWLDIKKIYDKNYLYTPPKTNEKIIKEIKRPLVSNVGSFLFVL